jgi:uncharacterized protein YecT (DUF1311 family)
MSMRLILIASVLAWAAPAAAAPQCPTSLPQEQLNQCWIDAYEAADERLDQLMRDLKQSLSSRNWSHIKESQVFWEKSRSIDCKVEAAMIDGPAREAVRHGCSVKRTVERMHQLRYLLCPRYNVTGQCDAERLYE